MPASTAEANAAMTTAKIGRHAVLGQEDRGVRAEADEGLLAYGHHAAVAGKGVPHDREDQKRKQAGELLNRVRAHQLGYRKQREPPAARDTTDATREARVDRRTSHPRGRAPVYR